MTTGQKRAINELKTKLNMSDEQLCQIYLMFGGSSEDPTNLHCGAVIQELKRRYYGSNSAKFRAHIWIKS